MNKPAHRKESPPTAPLDNASKTNLAAEQNTLALRTEIGPGFEPGASSPADQLTPEEQMRLFEKELKEKDWGHQPC